MIRKPSNVYIKNVDTGKQYKFEFNPQADLNRDSGNFVHHSPIKANHPYIIPMQGGGQTFRLGTLFFPLDKDMDHYAKMLEFWSLGTWKDGAPPLLELVFPKTAPVQCYCSEIQVRMSDDYATTTKNEISRFIEVSMTLLRYWELPEPKTSNKEPDTTAFYTAKEDTTGKKSEGGRSGGQLDDILNGAGGGDDSVETEEGA